MSLLEKAILIATKAHMNQKDKLGEPYIIHPLTVMLSLENESERIVAILHDVIEDTNVTLDNLKEEGFSKEVLEAIDCITKRHGENYLDYLGKIKQNELALKVKLADINHNMNPERLKELDPETAVRLREKYNTALKELSN